MQDKDKFQNLRDKTSVVYSNNFTYSVKSFLLKQKC